MTTTRLSLQQRVTSLEQKVEPLESLFQQFRVHMNRQLIAIYSKFTELEVSLRMHTLSAVELREEVTLLGKQIAVLKAGAVQAQSDELAQTHKRGAQAIVDEAETLIVLLCHFAHRVKATIIEKE